MYLKEKLCCSLLYPMLVLQGSGMVGPCMQANRRFIVPSESHESHCQQSMTQHLGLQAERQRLAQIPGMANPHEALKEEQMDD